MGKIAYLLVTAALITLLVYLFSHTRIDYSGYQVRTRTLLLIGEDNIRVRHDIFNAVSGLLVNQDQLAFTLPRIQLLYNHLRNELQPEILHDDQEMATVVYRLGNDLADQHRIILRIQESNAILKNSLSYFLVTSSGLNDQLGNTPDIDASASRAVAHVVNEMQRYVLRYSLGGDAIAAEKIVQGQAQLVSAPETHVTGIQKNIDSLVEHAGIIMEYQARTNTLLDELLALPVNAAIRTIEDLNDRNFEQSAQTAYNYRYLLFVVALVLLAHVALAFLWIRNTSTELSRTNASLVRESKERKVMEERARQHQLELAHVGRISILGEMVAYIAHEINQPLCAVLTYCRAIIDRVRTGPGAGSEIVEPLEQVAQQAQRASDIVSHLRTLIEKGTDDREPGDINQLIRTVTDFIASDTAQKNIDIHLLLKDPLPYVNMNRIHIEQVMLNLYRNAIEAIANSDRESGSVIVTTQAPDKSTVQISVEDNGPGMDRNNLKHMFQPFVTDKPGGLGLGLSLCRTIVEDHGGKVWAEPAGQRGLIVHFTLFAGLNRGQSPR